MMYLGSLGVDKVVDGRFSRLRCGCRKEEVCEREY